MRCTHESEDAVYLVRCSRRVGRCFAAVVARAVAAYGLRRTLLRFAVAHISTRIASHESCAFRGVLRRFAAVCRPVGAAASVLDVGLRLSLG